MRRARFPRRAFVLALMAAAGGSASAGPPPLTTNIVADGASRPSFNVGTTVAPRSMTGVVQISGGTVAGKTLFHSFSDFSLAGGDTAQWVFSGATYAPASPVITAAGVANVVSRVTGGNPSAIDGTLDSSALPNAVFYFINPAGIVFGAGAQVNAPRAAYVSTASELRFGSGEVAFSATHPTSTFSAANPVSFGFFGTEADLEIDGASLGSAGGKLSLSGANLTLAGPSITAGELDLFAIGAQAFDLPLSGPLASGAVPTGALAITGGSLAATTSAGASGGIQIAAGDLSNSGAILTSTTGATNAGAIAIMTSTLENLTGGVISADSGSPTAPSAGGAGGAITIRSAGLTNVGKISADSYGAGPAGSITINATGMGAAAACGATASNCVLNSGTISADSLPGSTGNAGAIRITTQALNNAAGADQTAEPGLISATAHPTVFADDGVTVVTPGSTGAAGAITIAADAIVNGDPAAGPGLIAASGFDGPNTAPPLGQASPGQITITDVNQDGGGALRNNGTIIAGTAGSANAGAVTLNLASVANTTTGTISAGSFLTIAGPGIVTNPNIGGAAGEVDIRAALLANAGTIAVDTAGTGVGGVIMIDTTQSGVAAACPGMAANCALNTGTIIADSEATASGDGGTITITTAALVNGVAGTTGAGVISASAEQGELRTTGSAGGPGSISILADSTLNYGVILNSGQGAKTASTRSGVGIKIVGATPTSDLSNFGVIATDTNKNLSSLDIVIQVASVENHLGGAITATSGTFSNANVGNITIAGVSLANSGNLSSNTSGSGNSGAISITESGAVLNNGYVTSDTQYEVYSSGGNAGNITITAAALTNAPVGGAGGVISASSSFSGAAGSITLSAATIANSGAIEADGLAGGGGMVSGSIALSGSDLQNAGTIETNTEGSFTGGNIRIDMTSVENSGVISSTSNSYGAGAAVGTIDITTGSLTNDAGVITTDAKGPGAAGNISITAQTVADGSGTISSSAEDQSNGNAGDVTIAATSLGIGAGGQITSSAAPGSTGAPGIITLTSDSITNAGTIATDAYGPDNGTGAPYNSKVGKLIIATASGAGGELMNSGYITSSTENTDNAGSIFIQMASVENLFVISSTSGNLLNPSATGNAGSITIHAASLENVGEATVVSDTWGHGNAGSIVITTAGTAAAGNAAGCATNCVANTGTISSTAQHTSLGNAGSISITTDVLTNEIDPTAEIVSSTGRILSKAQAGSAGAAGQITINANTILNGVAAAITTEGFNGVLAPGQTLPGQLSITGGELQNGGAISSGTTGTANAGTVTLTLATVNNLAGGTISSNSSATGAAGDITIATTSASGVTTDSVTNSGAITSDTSSTTAGAGKAGDITITTDSLTNNAYSSPDGFENGLISSSSTGAGAPGAITITAATTVNAGEIKTLAHGDGVSPNATLGTITISGGDLQNGGFIGSSTDDTDTAGDITLQTATVENLGFVGSDTSGLGSGGHITVTTGTLTNASIISSNSFSKAAPGAILIHADLTMNSGVIQTDAASGSPSDGTSAVGQIEISGNVGTGDLQNSGTISSSTASGRNAGAITITTGSVEILAGGLIRSDTLYSSLSGSGAAGDITITTNSLTTATSSEISSSSTGFGAPGRITIAAATILNGGAIQTTAVGGLKPNQQLGEITIGGGDLQNSGTISSSTIGADNAGDVTITTASVENLRGAAIKSDSGGAALKTATGTAGAVTIQTTSLSNQGTVSSDTYGASASAVAGDVTIDAATVENLAGGLISSSSFGEGAGGAVTIDTTAAGVTTDEVTNSGAIVTTTAAKIGGGRAGVAGNVTILTDTLVNNACLAPCADFPGFAAAIGDGTISSDTFGAGKAGSVTIDTTSAGLTTDSVTNGGQIVSDSWTGAKGAAGAIAITTSHFTNEMTSRVAYSNNVINGDISSRGYSATDGGTVTIRATDFVNDGVIDTEANAPAHTVGGNPGSILIEGLPSNAPNTVINAGTIRSLSDTALLPGTITIYAAFVTNGPQAGIDNTGTDPTHFNGSISTQSDGDSPGVAGDILIDTTRSGVSTDFLLNTGMIASDTIRGLDPVHGAAASAGSVTIITDMVTNEQGADPVTAPGLISSSSYAAGAFASDGRAGSITIRANTIVNGDATTPGGTITTAGFDGSNTAPAPAQSPPGQITITDVDMDGLGTLTNSGTISSETHGTANAGAVSITLASVSNLAGGVISSNTTAGGDAGDLSITTNSTGVTTDSVVNSGAITSDTTSAAAAGQAGDITITTDTFRNNAYSNDAATGADNGLISSSSTGSGAPGKITIAAAVVANAGQIQTVALNGSGAAGVVTLTGLNGGESGDLSNSGTISSSTRGSDAAGSITIETATVENAAGGVISSNTGSTTDTTASGAAGKVTITTGELMNQGEVSSDTYGSGSAGGITITTTGPAATTGAATCATNCLTNTGTISSTAKPGSLGDAGDITITTDTLRNLAPGEISSNADGPVLGSDGLTVETPASVGAAGKITIIANHVLNGAASVVNTGIAIPTSQATVTITGQGGSITTNAYDKTSTTGSGITITGPSDGPAVELQNTGTISADTNGMATGGSVTITAASVLDAGPGVISANTNDLGAGGRVRITTQTLEVVDGAEISSNASFIGAAGDVVIGGDLSTLPAPDPTTGHSLTPAAYEGFTNGLTKEQTTGFILIDGAGSKISSASTGGGFAGQVVILANRLYAQNGGAITTDSTPLAGLSAANGGDIYLLFPKGLVFPDGVLWLQGPAYTSAPTPTDIGVIRTNDPSGSGGGIYVYAPYALIQNGSLIQATGIVSQAQVILSPGAVIHSTDRFNSVDVAGLYVDSGTVEDLTGATVVQVPVFVDSEKVLKGQCPSQAASGETSRLIDQLKGPYGGSIAPAPGRVSVSDASPAMAGCRAGR